MNIRSPKSPSEPADSDDLWQWAERRAAPVSPDRTLAHQSSEGRPSGAFRRTWSSLLRLGRKVRGKTRAES